LIVAETIFHSFFNKTIEATSKKEAGGDAKQFFSPWPSWL